jgi:DNA ligase (NAD+)
VFTLGEFAEWAAKVERNAGRHIDYLCELKIDGLEVINLRENSSVLRTARTRGDRGDGEDVTENIAFVKVIPTTPARLRASADRRGAWRGLRVHDLRAAQRRPGGRGERVFANARNAASGSLRQVADNKTPCSSNAQTARSTEHAGARHRRVGTTSTR